MPRFYDRFIQIPKIKDDLRNYLRHAPVIVGDNVARYYYQDNPRETWLEHAHFPNQRPPFEPLMFFDFRAPTTINSEQYGPSVWKDHGHRPAEWGILLSYVDLLSWSPHNLEQAMVEIGGTLRRWGDAWGNVPPQDRAHLARQIAALKVLVEANGETLLRRVESLPLHDQALATRSILHSLDLADRQYKPTSLRQLYADIRADVAPRYDVQAYLACQWPDGHITAEWTWHYGVLNNGRIAALREDPNSWCLHAPIEGGSLDHGLSMHEYNVKTKRGA